MILNATEKNKAGKDIKRIQDKPFKMIQWKAFLTEQTRRTGKPSTVDFPDHSFPQIRTDHCPICSPTVLYIGPLSIPQSFGMSALLPKLKAKIMSYSVSWQIFFVKSQLGHSLDILGHTVSVGNYSTLPLLQDCSHRQHVKEWAQLCPNKNVLTKTGNRPVWPTSDSLPTPILSFKSLAMNNNFFSQRNSKTYLLNWTGY